MKKYKDIITSANIIYSSMIYSLKTKIEILTKIVTNCNMLT